jgi:hypothetical protein
VEPPEKSITLPLQMAISLHYRIHGSVIARRLTGFSWLSSPERRGTAPGGAS